MTKLLCALFLVALCSSFGHASIVPCPEYCGVEPLLGNPAEPFGQVAFLAPGPMTGTTITITVRDCSNAAIAGAAVYVAFNNAVETCVLGVHSSTTNALGVCTITLQGGGCLRNVIGGCVIVANGIEIRNLRHVRSPDNGSHTASVPDGTVSLVDLAFFGDEFKGVAPPACHDYDNNLQVNTTDLGYFGTAFGAGWHCDLVP